MVSMVNAEDYAKIVEVYRAIGRPNYAKAARDSGFSFETTKKAWLVGWPKLNMSPIKDLELWKVYTDALERPSVDLGTQKVSTGTQSLPGHNAPVSEGLGHNAPHSPKLGQNATVVVGLGQNATVDGASPAPVTRSDEPSHNAARQYTHVPTQTQDLAAVEPKSPAQLAAEAALLKEHRLIEHAGSMLEGSIVMTIRMIKSYKNEIEVMAEQLETDRKDFPKSNAPARTVEAMTQLMGMVPKLVGAQKSLMELRRLQLGMPQSISETRNIDGSHDEDGSTRKALDVLFATATPHTGRVIDVTPIVYEGEEGGETKAVAALK